MSVSLRALYEAASRLAAFTGSTAVCSRSATPSSPSRGDGWPAFSPAGPAPSSRRSAAALWGLRPADRGRVDVSASGRRGRGLDGIDAHRGSGLCLGDTTVSSDIPCTTPSRTLLDLAVVVDHAGLLRAIDRAEGLRIFDGTELQGAIRRGVGHPGIRALRAALAACADPALTRSQVEERFLALCETAGIARPRVNAIVEVDGGSIEVDFLWRGARLVVETDGRRSMRQGWPSSQIGVAISG